MLTKMDAPLIRGIDEVMIVFRVMVAPSGLAHQVL
jgi:hypothetical protein